jgi:hypothetical protein
MSAVAFRDPRPAHQPPPPGWHRGAARHATLRALVGAGDVGGVDPNTLQVGGDPFLRPRVRAAVQRAVADAQKATRLGDAEHVARVAFLRTAGLGGVDFDDAALVAELHDQYGRELPRSSGPWPVFLSILTALTAVAAVFAWIKLQPTPEERFRKTAFGVALGEPLVDFVVALNESGTSEVQAKKAAILTPKVEKQLGAEAYGLLEDALAQAARAVRGEGKLQPSLDAFADALVTAKVPAFLDSYSNGKTLWLMSFYAPSRHEVAWDGERLRVARVRRIDNLNLATTFYVWIRDGSRWAVLSLDGVEAKLGRELVPTLGGAPLAYGEILDPSYTAKVSKVLEAPLRAAFAEETKLSPADLKALAEAVVGLNDAKDRVRAKKNLLVGSDGLFLTPQELVRVEKQRSSDFDISEILRAHDRLVPFRAQVEKLAAIAADIDEETFVAQHLATKKEPVLTEAAREAGLSTSWGVSVASTRLASIAADRHAPVLWIEHVVREITVRENGAAAVVVRELAKELGRQRPEFEKAPETLYRNLELILGKPRGEIVAAAKKVHQRLFGAPPSVYARTPL